VEYIEEKGDFFVYKISETWFEGKGRAKPTNFLIFWRSKGSTLEDISCTACVWVSLAISPFGTHVPPDSLEKK
jgi:hypothetical protein